MATPHPVLTLTPNVVAAGHSNIPVNNGMMHQGTSDNRKSIPPPQPPQHFFNTPRGIVNDSGMMATGGSDSITTWSRSEDSRNPSTENRSSGGESYDDFSAKVRSEMRKVQADMRGGGIGSDVHVGHHPRQVVHSNLPNDPPKSVLKESMRPLYPRPAATSAVAEPLKGTQSNHCHDDQSIQNRRGTSKSSHLFHDSQVPHQNDENESRRGDEYKQLVERNKQVVERNKILERELAEKDCEIASLHSERRGGRLGEEHAMERNAHLEQRNKQQEQKLVGKDAEIAELTRQLQATEEAAQVTIASEKARAAQTHAQDLDTVEMEFEHALAVHTRENEILQKELVSMQTAIDEIIQDQTHDQMEEIHMLQKENEILRNENDDMKNIVDIAEQDVKLLEKENEDIKHIADTAQQDVELLRKENEDMKHMADTAQQDVELRQRTLKELESDYEDVVKEKMRLETVAADKTNNYKHLLEEKIRHERDNEELKHEMHCMTEEYDMMKGRLVVMAGMERDNEELKDELHCMTEEYDVMKGRLVLLAELSDALEVALDEKQNALVEKEDAIIGYNKLRNEQTILQCAKESMIQALNAALAEKEDAIVQYNELMREHTMLQSTKDSKLHVTEMVTRQRDKMSIMMDKYQEEIEELKGQNVDLREQRDDLKEELICVLETASVYPD